MFDEYREILLNKVPAIIHVFWKFFSVRWKKFKWKTFPFKDNSLKEKKNTAIENIENKCKINSLQRNR